MNGVDVGSYSYPSLIDQDNDGDFDMWVGAEDGTLSYFENTGSATNPVFTQRTGTDNPMNGVDVGEFATPTMMLRVVPLVTFFQVIRENYDASRDMVIASKCSECPQGNGASWCTGDCEWDAASGQCVDSRPFDRTVTLETNPVVRPAGCSVSKHNSFGADFKFYFNNPTSSGFLDCTDEQMCISKSNYVTESVCSVTPSFENPLNVEDCSGNFLTENLELCLRHAGADTSLIKQKLVSTYAAVNC
jgi:hypothetical protein